MPFEYTPPEVEVALLGVKVFLGALLLTGALMGTGIAGYLIIRKLRKKSPTGEKQSTPL